MTFIRCLLPLPLVTLVDRVAGRAKGVPHRSALWASAGKLARALADLDERAARRNRRIAARPRAVAVLLRFRAVYRAARRVTGVFRPLRRAESPATQSPSSPSLGGDTRREISAFSA